MLREQSIHNLPPSLVAAPVAVVVAAAADADGLSLVSVVWLRRRQKNQESFFFAAAFGDSFSLFSFSSFVTFFAGGGWHSKKSLSLSSLYNFRAVQYRKYHVPRLKISGDLGYFS